MANCIDCGEEMSGDGYSSVMCCSNCPPWTANLAGWAAPDEGPFYCDNWGETDIEFIVYGEGGDHAPSMEARELLRKAGRSFLYKICGTTRVDVEYSLILNSTQHTAPHVFLREGQAVGGVEALEKLLREKGYLI